MRSCQSLFIHTQYVEAENHAEQSEQTTESLHLLRVASREISEQKMQIIVGWADLPRLILGLLGFAP